MAVASAVDLPTKSGTVTCRARTATRMAIPANTKNVTARAPVRSRILPKLQTRVRISVDNRTIVLRWFYEGSAVVLRWFHTVLGTFQHGGEEGFQLVAKWQRLVDLRLGELGSTGQERGDHLVVLFGLAGAG